MPDLQQHTVVTTNGTRSFHRRRPPDAFERVFAAVLTGALLVSALLVIAAGFGAVWLIVVIVQDLVRRLGG